MTYKKKTLIPENLRGSAEKVWLAGLGALSAGQHEGSKLFKTMMDKGKAFEAEVRGKTSENLGEAKDKAEHSWDRVEENLKGFVERATEYVEPVKDHLSKLGGHLEGIAENLAEEMGIIDPEPQSPAPADKPAPAPSPAPAQPEEVKPTPHDASPYQLRKAKNGWYEILYQGKVIKKVQGKGVAEANLKAYRY